MTQEREIVEDEKGVLDVPGVRGDISFEVNEGIGHLGVYPESSNLSDFANAHQLFLEGYQLVNSNTEEDLDAELFRADQKGLDDHKKLSEEALEMLTEDRVPNPEKMMDIVENEVLMGFKVESENMEYQWLKNQGNGGGKVDIEIFDPSYAGEIAEVVYSVAVDPIGYMPADVGQLAHYMAEKMDE